MEIRGLPQGMGLFHITVGGAIRTANGWEGSLASRHPTFYVVGGNGRDAVLNTVGMLGLSVGGKTLDGATIESLHVMATNADPDNRDASVVYDGREWSTPEQCF